MAENLSLAEIFAWLRKRDTSALPETTRTMILEAWHTGRLPLVADKVREFRCACPVPPHTWVPEPAPDDEKAKRYVEELRKTQIVGYLPATAAQTTVTLEKVLFNQMVPAEIIPYRDIKFYWTPALPFGGILRPASSRNFPVLERCGKPVIEYGRRPLCKLRNSGPSLKSIIS